MYVPLTHVPCISSDDIKDVLVCIAHRGRLNLLTCLMKYPPVVMFRKVRPHKTAQFLYKNLLSCAQDFE